MIISFIKEYVTLDEIIKKRKIEISDYIQIVQTIERPILKSSNKKEKIKQTQVILIHKTKMNVIKQELNDFYKIVDIKLIELNPHLKDKIITFCTKKETIVKNLLAEYFGNITNGSIFKLPLFSICTQIIKQPIFIIEAIDLFNNNLNNNEITFYRHKQIKDKLEFGKNKFDTFNIKLEKEFNSQLLKDENKKNLLRLFLFTEQFINELKYYRPLGINYFESPLFQKFLNSILKYKSRFIAFHGNFDFNNINELIELNKALPPQPIHSKTGLSVSDWSIIFYYQDKTSKHQGTKVDRFKKFITENEIGTTPGNFKKEYYEVINRINQKENAQGKTLPPLPPERIKKILPYLKNNKKANKAAENDIGYLTNELSIYKENT